MGKIRSIKPEFFTDADLYDLEKSTGMPVRVGFAGMWTQVDREGRFRWRPRELKLQILPFDDVDFGLFLDVLLRAGMVKRYEFDGKAYGVVVNFVRHQRPHKKEPPSEIPQPPSGFVHAPENPVPTPENPDCDPTATGSKPGGREGKGREGNEKTPPGLVEVRIEVPRTLPPDFKLTAERGEAMAACGVDLGRCHIVFADFCDDARRKAKRSADWDADLRMWCRREERFTGPSGRHGKTTDDPWAHLPEAVDCQVCGGVHVGDEKCGGKRPRPGVTP